MSLFVYFLLAYGISFAFVQSMGPFNIFQHIRDMDWFREHGIVIYDWGNISSSVRPNGIDRFKMSFGGKVTTVYNTFVGNTFLGKILVLLYKFTH